MAGEYQPKAQLGATFYPGGQDDFYMPEVVSPAPQRYARAFVRFYSCAVVGKADLKQDNAGSSI
jgi:hypothetical protein